MQNMSVLALVTQAPVVETHVSFHRSQTFELCYNVFVILVLCILGISLLMILIIALTIGIFVLAAGLIFLKR